LQKVGPLDEPADTTLKADGSNIPADTLHEPAGQYTAPPSLNFDRCAAEVLVFPHCHTPAHILLHNRDEGIELFRAEGLQCREHTSPEENLCETTLIFVRVIESLLKNK